MSSARHIVVIGGGASGVLVTARLLDASTALPVRVTIVEPSGRLGAGVAYGTEDPDHLVNVRASAMSADPSRPDELLAWVRGEHGGCGPDTFVARRDYRRYLGHHLARAAAGATAGSFEVRAERAEAIDVVDGGVRVRLSTSEVLEAATAVLAIGNPPPGTPEPFADVSDHPAWVADPWGPGRLASVDRASRILLVGTGLTMADVAITLARDHVEGPGDGPVRLTAISRTGLVPHAHLEVQPARPMQVIDLDRDGADVLELAARLRARGADGVGSEYPDEDWREVIDAVRPFANALWRRFDVTQRQLFVDRLARDWDVHRHRMAPLTARRVGALRDDGRLSVGRGRVLEVHAARDDRLRVVVDDGGDVRSETYDAVVNCTGPGRPWDGRGPSLVSGLLSAGVAVRDDLGLGLLTDAEGLLVDRCGRSVPEVLVIGPPRRGALWETTAIPELRSQALHIADRIVSDRRPTPVAVR